MEQGLGRRRGDEEKKRRKGEALVALSHLGVLFNSFMLAVALANCMKVEVKVTLKI